MTGQQVGYERPPLVTLGDISGHGYSTLGSTSPAFAMQQAAAQADSTAPVMTAEGPRRIGGHILGLAVVGLVAFAAYADRRLLPRG